jgi:DNA-binding XRE family transcriptional regulator
LLERICGAWYNIYAAFAFGYLSAEEVAWCFDELGAASFIFSEAEKLGLSQQTISKYENGILEPNILTLVKLSDLFHCSIDYLLGRVDDLSNYYPSVMISMERLTKLCEEKHITKDQLVAILVSKGVAKDNLEFCYDKGFPVNDKLLNMISDYLGVDSEYLTKPQSLEEYIKKTNPLMLYGHILDENDKQIVLTAIRIVYETTIKKNKEHKEE